GLSQNSLHQAQGFAPRASPRTHAFASPAAASLLAVFPALTPDYPLCCAMWPQKAPAVSYLTQARARNPMPAPISSRPTNRIGARSRPVVGSVPELVLASVFGAAEVAL